MVPARRTFYMGSKKASLKSIWACVDLYYTNHGDAHRQKAIYLCLSQNIFAHQAVFGAIVALTQLSLRANPLFSVEYYD
jgi:hypothetical protein